MIGDSIWINEPGTTLFPPSCNNPNPLLNTFFVVFRNHPFKLISISCLYCIQSNNLFLYVLIGFVLFFFIEKILHWRHCHKGKCSVHTFAYMNLFGDAIHNFIDGLIIAASFVTNTYLGVITTLAVALHEIPQEIGDFGILVYGGFSKTKALFFNFASGLIAVLGAVLTLSLGAKFTNFIPLLIPFTAGGFIYIASSDLIPELKKETKPLKSLLQFFGLLLGIGLMMVLAINE